METLAKKTRQEIAEIMSQELGVEVNKDLIVKLPTNNSTGYLVPPSTLDVFAAHVGNSTILAYVSKEVEILFIQIQYNY